MKNDSSSSSTAAANNNGNVMLDILIYFLLSLGQWAYGLMVSMFKFHSRN